MIIIGIVTSIVILCFYNVTKDLVDFPREGKFFYFLVFNLGVSLGFLIAIAIPNFSGYKYEKISTEKLININEVNGISCGGNILFFSSNSEPKFTYYVKNHNYYELKNINAKHAKIRYSNTTPKIIKYRKVPNNLLFGLKDVFTYIYIIEIPKNSIVKKYNLGDAK